MEFTRPVQGMASCGSRMALLGSRLLGEYLIKSSHPEKVLVRLGKQKEATARLKQNKRTTSAQAAVHALVTLDANKLTIALFVSPQNFYFCYLVWRFVAERWLDVVCNSWACQYYQCIKSPF